VIGILLTATGVLVVAVYAIDRVYNAAANRLRASHQVTRALDRAAYWRLHRRYTALCSAGTTVEQASAAADQMTCPDEPIPYTVDEAAWRPVWTGDNPHVAEYREIANAARRARGVAR
jgi:hypothetical protein